MLKTIAKKTTKKKASTKIAKANPSPLTIKEIKKDLKSKGVKLEVDREAGEYILFLEEDPSVYATIGFDTLDNYLDDVYQQGLKIAKSIKVKKKANPKKCRTIKVRRKISMGKGKRPRILQVRRKVCNPEIKGYGFLHNELISSKNRTKFLNELNNLESTKVKVFSGKPLSESNLKSPKLIISGTLYETATDRFGRGFEVSGDLDEVHFDLDDILTIKGKNIYLNNIS